MRSEPRVYFDAAHPSTEVRAMTWGYAMAVARSRARRRTTRQRVRLGGRSVFGWRVYFVEDVA